MFWVLCIALARANPKNSASQYQIPNAAYDRFCRHFLLEDDSASLRESRGLYLEKSEDEWREILHPDLGEAASLLDHMGKYLGIRTLDAKRETWGPYHAHDMFKLLLFSTIQQFHENPVPLCTHAPRYTKSLSTTRSRTPVITTSLGSRATVESSLQNHSYDTRTKETFGSGPLSGSKRPREDYYDGNGDENDGDDVNDRDYIPPESRSKKPRLEQAKLSADLLKTLSENPRLKDYVVHEMASKELDMFKNRELWFFFGGQKKCLHCAQTTV
jgi:hypothetical protein